jgi:hypothetical protein
MNFFPRSTKAFKNSLLSINLEWCYFNHVSYPITQTVNISKLFTNMNDTCSSKTVNWKKLHNICLKHASTLMEKKHCRKVFRNDFLNFYFKKCFYWIQLGALKYYGLSRCFSFFLSFFLPLWAPVSTNRKKYHKAERQNKQTEEKKE